MTSRAQVTLPERQPDELRMFTDQPAAVGLMYAALEANRLRQCQQSGQVKGQSALSWLLTLGKLNPASKGTRAGPGFSAGPKGKEPEAEHLPPRVTIDDSRRRHIFRAQPGHLADTEENRNLILNAANDQKNYLGPDKWGNQWYAATQADGHQIWVQVRNGQIVNAGLNERARPWSPETGLSRVARPAPDK